MAGCRGHGEELSERVCSSQHRQIAGDGAECRQGVHSLGLRSAGHQLHGQSRYAPLGEPGQKVRALVRSQHAYDQGPGWNQVGLVDPVFALRRAIHLQHYVGPFEQCLRVFDDLRSRLPVFFVRERRGHAGAALHREGVAFDGKALDRRRSHGHALLEGRVLPGHYYSHGWFTRVKGSTEQGLSRRCRRRSSSAASRTRSVRMLHDTAGAA
jgi:hypothetical protein